VSSQACRFNDFKMSLLVIVVRSTVSADREQRSSHPDCHGLEPGGGIMLDTGARALSACTGG
jgi:hypothetical protein